MFLVADSGSTKTSWCLFDATDKQHFITEGMNPFFIEEEEITNILRDKLPVDKSSVSEIYFYGAGCTPEKRSLVENALKRYFEPEKIAVNSDLLGAARALCRDEEGIACILGTGSNSCYYNGENIAENISPLGFILGDEGSGAALGKKLLSDVLKKQLSRPLINDFYFNYGLSTAEILDKVYRQPFPNRFLAQFAPFISDYIHFGEIANLVESSFAEFITKNVLPYEKALQLPVHFAGSIAWHFRNNLTNVLHKYHVQAGTIVKEPLDGLVEYHLKNAQA